MNDLISRQGVLKLIENTPYDWSNMTERTDMLRKIKALPSADVPDTNIGEWTPCSERLPKATKLYICTVNRELFDVRTMKFEMLAEGGYRWLLMNGSEVFPSFVLAWMPLPKPWKGVDDETH